MTKEELIHLFKVYLNREPNEHDIKRHLDKKYNSFEIEIANCIERMTVLLKNGVKHKIAILLTGHVRNLNIKDSINKLYPNYDVDVFVFAWDNVGIKGKETDPNDPSDPNKISKTLEQLQNVRLVQLENNKEFIEKHNNTDTTYFNYSSPEIFIKSQLYSIHKCYEMMERYAEENCIEYDLVLRSRMDCEFTSFNPDIKTFFDIKTHDIIFVPNSDNRHDHPDHGTSCWACDTMYYKHDLKAVHIFEHTNIICDLFAYGNMKSMKKYCSLYLDYDKMNKDFLKDNLKSLDKNKNINCVKEGNVYKLLDFTKSQDRTTQKQIHEENKLNHVYTMYYFYCSYPERLLQKYLRDYMLVKSSTITMRFYR